MLFAPAQESVRLQSRSLRQLLQGQAALIFGAPRDSRRSKPSGDLSDLYWLPDEQMAKHALLPEVAR
ncbi:hypothetical protein, partial [uncultured Ruegeria sp.]|uniref:hypothetical protein n=1 Tax=uncultured Ruegeria sp. TaxID=259304 RepID=UPI002608FC6F